MTDLSELRERLHLDAEMLVGAAAIEALDNLAMRLAILDALAIRDSAERLCEVQREPSDRQNLRAEAMEAMADRLRELHSVPGRNVRVEAGLDD